MGGSEKLNVFRYTDYKRLLREQVRRHAGVYGYRSQLARAAGCQKSFLSQVLNGPTHLTPDHAAGLARHWGFSADETEYFMECVHYGRAGSKHLKDYLKSRMHRLKEQSELDTQTFEGTDLDRHDAATHYYSAWQFSAAHVLMRLPDVNTSEELAARLRIPRPFA